MSDKTLRGAPSLDWPPAPLTTPIPTDEIHLWRVPLSITVEELESCRSLLSAEERARADRLISPEKSRQFVACRGRLRRILAHYLQLPQESLEFSTGPQGKPELSGETTKDLSFNISHSGDLALVAVTCSRAIGVDLETIDPDLPTLDIAQRYFSPNECQALLELPEENRRRAFYNCWTRKEAYLKATGRGITEPLDSFDVSLDPEAPAALLCHRGKPQEVVNWSMSDIDVGPGHVAALAVKGPLRPIRRLSWVDQETVVLDGP